MKLTLQAIKSLFRNVRNKITLLSYKVTEAQNTAIEAQNTAIEAQNLSPLFLEITTDLDGYLSVPMSSYSIRETLLAGRLVLLVDEFKSIYVPHNFETSNKVCFFNCGDQDNAGMFSYIYVKGTKCFDNS